MGHAFNEPHADGPESALCLRHRQYRSTLGDHDERDHRKRGPRNEDTYTWGSEIVALRTDRSFTRATMYPISPRRELWTPKLYQTVPGGPSIPGNYGILRKHSYLFPDSMGQIEDSRFAGRVSVPNLHGFSALMVFSSVAARLFLPQVSGAGATPSRREARREPAHRDHARRGRMGEPTGVTSEIGIDFFGCKFRQRLPLVAFAQDHPCELCPIAGRSHTHRH
jgi:hypothetical protein